MTSSTSRSNAAEGGDDSTSCSHERIAELAGQLGGTIDSAIAEIYSLNGRTRMLSFNAQIEAARCGAAGSTFGVVALAMRELAESIGKVADAMKESTRETRREMQRVSDGLAINVRGTRLSDLAMTNIDLIDRNLYERSCDCRWWATDSSLVAALDGMTDGGASDGARQYAANRMGVILNAYTVYLDLVLADLTGRIVANGRPDQYASQGSSHADATWFRSAMATASGDEFGFQSAHESSLVGGQRALVYSAGVRRGGEVRGALLGVLGIVFHWDSLAQTIVKNTPLLPEEKTRTRVCIVDGQHAVLADSYDRQLRDRLNFPGIDRVLASGKSFAAVDVGGKPCLVAHAKSTGFETYATGWHSLIIQETARTASVASGPADRSRPAATTSAPAAKQQVAPSKAHAAASDSLAT